jgi:hypothetical protein
VSSDDDELVGDLRSGGDPERVARSAKALVIRADALLDQGSADEALKVLDTVIDALDGSADIEPRKVLALALATKSATLKQLGRRHAMRPFEAMISQYGTKPWMSLMRRRCDCGQLRRHRIASGWPGYC